MSFAGQSGQCGNVLWVRLHVCIHLHLSACFFGCLWGLWSYTCTALCVCACMLYIFKAIWMCVCISMCVSCVCQEHCYNSLWLRAEALAANAVGLAGLSRALKQLCRSARLRWWLRARLCVTLKSYSTELLTGRPPAWKQDSVTMSYCWQPS